MESVNSNYQQAELERIARKRVRKIRRFFSHLIIYLIGVTVYVLREYFDAPFRFPPLDYINHFFMLIWTFIIAAQGLKVFMKEVVLGKEWEKRQMQKIIDSESNAQN
jgi:2TM domain-containing protein